MTIRVLLAALALAFSPVIASAACYGGHEQTMSCSDGQIWDTNTRACVDKVTS